MFLVSSHTFSGVKCLGLIHLVFIYTCLMANRQPLSTHPSVLLLKLVFISNNPFWLFACKEKHVNVNEQTTIIWLFEVHQPFQYFFHGFNFQSSHIMHNMSIWIVSLLLPLTYPSQKCGFNKALLKENQWLISP